MAAPNKPGTPFVDSVAAKTRSSGTKSLMCANTLQQTTPHVGANPIHNGFVSRASGSGDGRRKSDVGLIGIRDSEQRTTFGLRQGFLIPMLSSSVQQVWPVVGNLDNNVVAASSQLLIGNPPCTAVPSMHPS